MKVGVEFRLLKGETELSQPFLEIQLEQRLLPSLIEDTAKLGKYIPLALVVGGYSVTGLEYTSEATIVKGQPVLEVPR